MDKTVKLWKRLPVNTNGHSEPRQQSEDGVLHMDDVQS
jgi:hypothetical protein